MTRVLIHVEIFDDLALCAKRWYPSLGTEMPRISRLLQQDGRLPGEGPYHYVKLQPIQNRTFHARINLPDENIGKQGGARIIYAKETLGVVKILYVGGHKDSRYTDSHSMIFLIEQRYSDDKFIEFTVNLDFDNHPAE
ncbi:MAG: hypothetical protein AAB539_04345 [Patescibacteria group bacterium]